MALIELICYGLQLLKCKDDIYKEMKDPAKALDNYKRALNTPNFPEAKRVREAVLLIERTQEQNQREGKGR